MQSDALSLEHQQVKRQYTMICCHLIHTNTYTQKVQNTAIQPENDFTVHGFCNICHDHCHQPTQSTIYSFQTSKRPLPIKKNVCNHKKQCLAALSSTTHLSFYLSQQQSTASKHAWAGGMRGAIE